MPFWAFLRYMLPGEIVWETISSGLEKVACDFEKIVTTYTACVTREVLSAEQKVLAFV